ncbi:uncharacterized protein EV154DRAFT_569997 [Mucor mucedo]|uniref:uncharacterized protein n=1 Tax=Mucor mucedo TaxID=29922 RepID=UPI00221F5F06|nr:uncharacterized protein EV154DRAFT_569997 [Mucor mucedo]KAI7873570.1 hypothetical protein EV154DRAFT_569997 [Mucor mucedo]
MKTPNSFTTCRSEVMVSFQGRVTQQLKLNVAFGTDVSGTMKIQCAGRNINLLIRNYGMLYNLNKAKHLDEVAAYGTQVIRPFMSGITNKQPNYAHSVNVEIMWTAGNTYEKGEPGSDIPYKYDLLRSAYMEFENSERVFRGTLDPKILYKAVETLHAVLEPNDTMVKEREFTEDDSAYIRSRRRIMDIVISERPADQAPAAPQQNPRRQYPPRKPGRPEPSSSQKSPC